MNENEIREYALMKAKVAADRYAMARIRTVVLWSNQTE